MLGFGAFHSAQRFCRAFEEMRQYFRPRRKRRQFISLPATDDSLSREYAHSSRCSSLPNQAKVRNIWAGHSSSCETAMNSDAFGTPCVRNFRFFTKRQLPVNDSRGQTGGGGPHADTATGIHGPLLSAECAAAK